MSSTADTVPDGVSGKAEDDWKASGTTEDESGREDLSAAVEEDEQEHETPSTELFR